MAFEAVPIAAGLSAFLPGLVAIYFLYAPYDGHFKDNIAFLWFVGGLLLGTPVALLGAWVFELAPPLLYVVGAPALESGAMLVFLNRRKWQQNRQAVWNGGAMGAGMGAMLALVVAYQTFAGTFSWPKLGFVVALSTGVGLAHVAAGLRLGAGVVEGTPFRAYAVAALLLAPVAFLLFARVFFTGDVDDLPFSAALVAVGVGAVVLARSAWLPTGLDADAQRRIRRAARAESP